MMGAKMLRSVTGAWVTKVVFSLGVIMTLGASPAHATQSAVKFLMNTNDTREGSGSKDPYSAYGSRTHFALGLG